MIQWIEINSPKIAKIAYNFEIKMMYIDFVGSTIDTPYSGVSKETFTSFSEAEDADKYYDSHIKSVYKKVEIDIKNTIDLNT